MFYIVDNYITFNLIIRFHELKCLGKEIIEATPRDPRHNILPPVVALTWRYNHIPLQLQELFF